jgi:integrase
MESYRTWPKTLEGLVDMARDEIMEEFNEQNDDPTKNYPDTAMLDDMGYSHLRWRLSKKHDMTVKTFFTTLVGVTDERPRWNLEDPKTITQVEKFLDYRQKYRPWAETTKETNYHQLNRVFKNFSQIANNDNIIDLANNKNYKTDIYDWLVETIHRIRQKAKSDNSTQQYINATKQFFAWLERRSVIKFNPCSKIEKEFDLDLKTDGSVPLTPEQVAKLWDEADDLVEYIVIIGYVFWGVRRQELAKVRYDQFTLDNKIEIEFESHQRKNDAGIVTVVVGENIIRKQFERLKSKSDWNGHLLVDSDNPSQPMKPDKTSRIFQNVCKSADVRIGDGEIPTANNGRATWHDLNAQAETVLMEMEYIDDQDYEDTKSPLGYQGPDTKNAVRRFLFKKRFFSELPDEATVDGRVVPPNFEEQYDLTEEEFRQGV